MTGQKIEGEMNHQHEQSERQTSFHRLKVYRDAAIALLLLNKHCEEIGKDLYTITPVQTCYCNLKLKFKKIRKRSQGFTDVSNSPWCKAIQSVVLLLGEGSETTALVLKLRL
jgi:hypothetical protein